MSCSELQNQELNAQMEKINNLVSKYVGQIKILNNGKPITDCIPGTLCYAQKITQELKDAYLVALEKVRISPIELREAEKNYITNTQGEYGYHQLLVQRATKLATDEAVKLFDKFIETLNETQYTIETLNTNYSSNVYLSDISEQTTANNENLQDAISNTNTDNITKNRKSYYEQEEYNTLKRWYLFWFYVYIFLLLVFTLAIFLTNSDYSFMSKLGFLTLFILYLFGIKYIINGLVYIYKFSTNLFPKNIYLNI
jgi:hypothetical protein